jgi:hypothetical protein
MCAVSLKQILCNACLQAMEAEVFHHIQRQIYIWFTLQIIDFNDNR